MTSRACPRCSYRASGRTIHQRADLAFRYSPKSSPPCGGNRASTRRPRLTQHTPPALEKSAVRGVYRSYTNDMDMYIASEIARLLGTSIPRVQRAIRRLQLRGHRGGDGRMRFTSEAVDRLREELGVTPTLPGFSLIELRVLAALVRAPLGVTSVRALAGRAGISPTAASHAVLRLIERGLVLREERMLAAGSARLMTVMRANVLAAEWPRLAPVLARVIAPRQQSKHTRQVPRHLRHLFWNTDRSQMDTENAGGYIARRLLSTGDFEGLAWGSTQLSAADWEHAANSRGITPEQQALAHNIAASRKRAATP